MDSLFRMFLSFRPPFSGLNGQHWGKRHTLTVGPAGLRGRVAGQRGRRGPLTFPGAHSDEAEGGRGRLRDGGGGGDAGAELGCSLHSLRQPGGGGNRACAAAVAAAAPAGGPARPAPGPAPPPPRPHPPSGVRTPVPGPSRAPHTHTPNPLVQKRPTRSITAPALGLPTLARGGGLRLWRPRGWSRPPASPGHPAGETLPPQ